MELKFTGLVEVVYPIKWSGENKDYPRQPIKVKGTGTYHKHYWLFSLHWENIKQYPINEGDVVDVYYRMNTWVYADTGIPHGSNNVISIVQVDEDYDNYF
jgi:hypothetical protein